MLTVIWRRRQSEAGYFQQCDHLIHPAITTRNATDAQRLSPGARSRSASQPQNAATRLPPGVLRSLRVSEAKLGEDWS